MKLTSSRIRWSAWAFVCSLAMCGGAVAQTVGNTCTAGQLSGPDALGQNLVCVGGTFQTSLTITAAGNVGIGTTSPGALLTLGNSAGTMGKLRLQPIGGGAYWDVYNDAGDFKIDQVTVGNKFFIDDANGNVGIGTTGPTLGLHVSKGTSGLPVTTGTAQTYGIARFQEADSAGVLDMGMNGASGAWLQSTNGAALGTNYPLLLNPNGGNVGIGTTSPDTRLVVKRADGVGINDSLSLTMANGAVGDGSYIKWFGATGLEKIAAIAGVIENTDQGTLRFYRGNGSDSFTESMRIDSTGNVGIGTTNPSSALHLPDGKYAQFSDFNAGAPPGADCDNDTERGRQSLDSTNFRLYICMGATRGWDYVALTN